MAGRLPRGTQVLLLCLLFLSALPVLLSGCGASKPGGATAEATRPPLSSEVRLLVGRDFGEVVLVDVLVPYREGMSVMRLLAENTEVETGYGGGFVGAINGLRSTFGKVGPGEASDWFYWVDGSLADIGADYSMLAGGQTVWWDFHTWGQAAFIPASLACFPAPFSGGQLAVYAGDEAESLVRWAKGVGLEPGLAGEPSDWLAAWTGEASRADGARSLVSMSYESLLREGGDGTGLDALLSSGPARGMFVGLRDGGLISLTLSGSDGPVLDAVALPLRNFDDLTEFSLLLLYRDEDSLQKLLSELHSDGLRGRLALGVSQESVVPLPAVDSPPSGQGD